MKLYTKESLKELEKLLDTTDIVSVVCDIFEIKFSQAIAFLADLYDIELEEVVNGKTNDKPNDKLMKLYNANTSYCPRCGCRVDIYNKEDDSIFCKRCTYKLDKLVVREINGFLVKDYRQEVNND